jgi:dihydrofolate reductase
MRKIVYHIATSVDGYIAGKNGSVDNFLMEGEHVSDFVESLKNYDTVIMGRTTYEFAFQYGLKAGEPAYEGLKHIIVSTRMSFESNACVYLLSENISEYFRNLKEEAGKDIWLCGGGKLASFLLSENLIDELVLKVNPFIMGKGIKLFESYQGNQKLKCISSKGYDNSVRLDRYELINLNSG